MISHHATAQTGERLCRGDTLSGGARNGEGGVTLAAKADARIGGSVLDEDGGLNSLCEAGEVVDVLGVHVGGVTVAMLGLASQINGLVNVLDTDDTQNGHHQLLLHEEMLEGNLCDGAADLGAHVDADLGENDVSVTAYAVAVDYVRDLAGLLFYIPSILKK